MAADVDVVRGVYQAFGEGNIGGVLDALADDVDWVWHGPPSVPWAGSHRGKDAMLRFFGTVGANVSIEAYEPREFHPGADGTVTVLGWQRVKAIPTGKVWETHFAHIFTLVGGKIARAREFYDTAAVAEAFTD